MLNAMPLNEAYHLRYHAAMEWPKVDASQEHRNNEALYIALHLLPLFLKTMPSFHDAWMGL